VHPVPFPLREKDLPSPQTTKSEYSFPPPRFSFYGVTRARTLERQALLDSRPIKPGYSTFRLFSLPFEDKAYLRELLVFRRRSGPPPNRKNSPFAFPCLPRQAGPCFPTREETTLFFAARERHRDPSSISEDYSPPLQSFSPAFFKWLKMNSPVPLDTAECTKSLTSFALRGSLQKLSPVRSFSRGCRLRFFHRGFSFLLSPAPQTLHHLTAPQLPHWNGRPHALLHPHESLS